MAFTIDDVSTLFAHTDVKPTWWKEACVYQIYPSSFKDGNGDGRGDLRGIIEKLDYLQYVGVNVIWLCPIYKGPGVDEGYDISDYRDIDPKFGSLADWDELLEGLHKRDMKLIMDLVVNHSSDQHPWFLESKSSRSNPKRDWYMWRDAKYNEKGERIPPNNWRSIFGGSAWEWYEECQSYGLHIFAKEQPDLNWECDELREAVFDDMRFWLDKGIDGFRLDAITHISKQPGLADAPVTEPEELYQSAFTEFNHGPKVHEWLQEMNAKVLSNYDVTTVGEAGGTSTSMAIDYIHQEREVKEMDMIFQGDHVDLHGPMDLGEAPPKNLRGLKEVMNKWQMDLIKNKGWNSLFCENHDQPRSVTRYTNDSPQYRERCSKLLAMMFLSMCGTPYIYQGQEIGMVNVPKDWPIEEYLDLVSIRHYEEHREKLQKSSGEENPDMSGIMAGINRKARDNSRTPMPWTSEPEKVGFSTVTPWMKANPDNDVCNVEDQIKDENSVLQFWRRLIKMRKEKPILVYGDYQPVEYPGTEDSVFAFTRHSKHETFLVVLNMDEHAQSVEVEIPEDSEVILSNLKREEGSKLGGKVRLEPYEAILLSLKE